MRIGEVAESLGIPASAIRYYERMGLIGVPERVSGRRSFGQSELTMLRFIKLAQAAGFSISEIRNLCAEYSTNPSPSGIWMSFAEEKREEVQAQIEALSQVESILSELLACKCESLLECVEAADEQHPRK